jgi:hypothetical protein
LFFLVALFVNSELLPDAAWLKILLLIGTYVTGEMEIEHDEKVFGDVCFHSPNKDSRYDTCLC